MVHDRAPVKEYDDHHGSEGDPYKPSGNEIACSAVSDLQCAGDEGRRCGYSER